ADHASAAPTFKWSRRANRQCPIVTAARGSFEPLGRRNIAMNDVRPRPFYAEYAWAFDLLIDRPVQKECAVIAAWLVDRGILPGAEILDAGCGTGRYSRELARRGYIVHGVDLSPELIEIAKGTVEDRTGG